MPQLLQLDSSANLETSVSRELTRLFADTWRRRGPDHTVIERDLHRDPVPHLRDAELHYAPRLRAPGASVDPAAEALQTELIAEARSADAVVIGAPMYNWSLPSTLKAWIDYVHVLGTTVPFDTPDQPFAGTPVVVISSRGLAYGPGDPDEGLDCTVPPLQQVLGTSLGMDVTVVTAEYTLAGRIPALESMADRSAASLDAAREKVQRLAHDLGA
ncbi:NAD(P)H-dependent oxidoreductase [Rhodococcus sp. CSLK01-03]|uniref:FMN dependent NADH:quinone oxidoreductase n=1 Tax=Rhodococcus indonesiensis TaxID=3055869 RepID=A0ABT7RNH4_9NOCA|nr:NAD(P)H-dependent oxidoreductase [Rhodococcus indonesiensis]MDM7488576.1 NAD(P)H-dependent oxidoreductase [Rhodococcus indonesiensis]